MGLNVYPGDRSPAGPTRPRTTCVRPPIAAESSTCEILALKWPDFDFEEGTLMITRGTVHGRIGRVKTEYSEDEMPLDPAFAHIIQKWRMQCPASEGRWVFPNPNTGGVWHSSVLQGDILVPAGKKVGVLRLGWHTFRHSYRSLLDACGAPIGVQQKLLRHAQVSTTMKYGGCLYGRKTEGAQRRCADGIAREACCGSGD